MTEITPRSLYLPEYLHDEPKRVLARLALGRGGCPAMRGARRRS